MTVENMRKKQKSTKIQVSSGSLTVVDLPQYYEHNYWSGYIIQILLTCKEFDLLFLSFISPVINFVVTYTFC